MSKKTTAFKRKVAQALRKGVEVEVLIPRARVISKGRTTRLVEINPRMGGEDSINITFDGEAKVYKRFPGHASGRVGTEPMNPEKADRLKKLR